MSAPGGRLFCFGLGYSALALARVLIGAGWTVSGTCRSAEKAADLRARGFAAELFERGPAAAGGGDGRGDACAGIGAARSGRRPGARPPRRRHRRPLRLAWLGYLSTTGVYGDRGGGWVDETSALRPSGERGRRRAAAEIGWLELWRRRGVPVHIFRLAAIYGPGRSPFAALRAGTARRIDKPGQVFSRIHVEDLARVLLASMRPAAARRRL